MYNHELNVKKVYAQLKALYLLVKEKGQHPSDRDESFRGKYFELEKNNHLLTIRVDGSIDKHFGMAYVNCIGPNSVIDSLFHYYVCKDFDMYHYKVTEEKEASINKVYNIFIEGKL